ncbi:MAG: pilin [Methylococcales bacterium]|nr:pilin [Methylococcales bacterium]
MRVREFYDEEGQLPSSNQVLGLESPEVYANPYLHSMTILPDGIIKMVFLENTRVKGGIVRYIPTVVPGQIKWACEMPDYKEIAKYYQCQYKPEAS